MEQSARSRPPVVHPPADDTLAEVIPFPGGVALDPIATAPAPHVHTIECSPLHGATRLTGRVVTDPAQVAAIRRRVEAGVRADARRGAWRRTLRRIRRGR